MALMNCEIYVLNRLQKLEEENENLKENLQELIKTAEELKKLKEILIKLGKIKTYYPASPVSGCPSSLCSESSQAGLVGAGLQTLHSQLVVGWFFSSKGGGGVAAK